MQPSAVGQSRNSCLTRDMTIIWFRTTVHLRAFPCINPIAPVAATLHLLAFPCIDPISPLLPGVSF
jgi:hypothetical protein